MTSGSRDFFTEVFRCTDKFKFSSEGVNKRVLEDSGDEPMSKYRRVFDEAVNLTTTNGSNGWGGSPGDLHVLR